MRSLTAAILYPGVCLLEFARNVSMGRGTDAPFEQIGADFIRGPELADYLNRRQIPGLRVYPTSFTPDTSNLKGKRIEGVRFQLTNREVFDATRLGLELAAAVQKLYPSRIDWTGGRRLIGSDAVIKSIQAGDDPRTIQQSFQDPLKDFVSTRDKYLLYR
jgi:uncharacterized protein YbbC (DUF1343 family)